MIHVVDRSFTRFKLAEERKVEVKDEEETLLAVASLLDQFYAFLIFLAWIAILSFINNS